MVEFFSVGRGRDRCCCAEKKAGTSVPVTSVGPSLRLGVRPISEARDSLQDGFYLIDRDEPRALELARGVLVAWTP
jgi:hypothetical protein